MQISNGDRAKVLVQALPYIQQYAGKTVVIKYGGNAMINEELKQAVMSDIVLMQLVGINVVLVHGGGPEISVMLKKINKGLVNLLQSIGGRAVGLCGMDGGMLRAEKLSASEDLGYVGEIVEVNTQIIEDATSQGYVPVISTVAAGVDGHAYNINADIAAAQIAAKLNARKLILMTDIRGLLRDKDDESTLIPVVNVSSVPKLQHDGIISGGMIPKIQCCVEAVRRGVSRAHIIDGRIPHSILIELFTDEGIGTMLY